MHSLKKRYCKPSMPTVDAQIQFCKNAYDMWTYIKYAYEDRTAQQLNSAVREVHHIAPETCSSVHEVLDKLVALRMASIETGELLPENYWVIEATRLVSDLYPRETCEALQHPQCTLLTMRQHFATFVRDSVTFQSTIFDRSADIPSVATTAPATTYRSNVPGIQFLSLPSSNPANVFPAPTYINTPSTTAITPMSPNLYQQSFAYPQIPQQAPVVYQTPTSIDMTKLSPFKTRVYNSYAAPAQQTPYVSAQTPQFAQQVPPILYPSQMPVIEQPRYPPPGSYRQTLPNLNRRVCYSCGISGHWAEFCPNFNLPVCYSCKGIGHKRPLCPLAWLAPEQHSQQPLVSPASVRPSIPPGALQPPLPLTSGTEQGKLYMFNLAKPI